MKIVETVAAMQAQARALKSVGHTIALVPTMGFLHEGHLELIRVGKKNSDKLIISIFVNPTQFGPKEDYEEYPRDIDADIAKARDEGVDVVFIPSVQEMYPDGFQTTVKVAKVSLPLCGATRPGHFDGVATVVAKLFNIIRPHLAVFGQKDFQQLTVISRMVMDLNMDVQIVGVHTVREPDGLAMSSRNVYLSPEERKAGLSLKRSLDLAEHMFKSGERDAKIIRDAVVSLLRGHPSVDIEYVSLCDPVLLENLDTLGNENLLALAVRVGKTRLIDNCLLRGTSH